MYRCSSPQGPTLALTPGIKSHVEEPPVDDCLDLFSTSRQSGQQISVGRSIPSPLGARMVPVRSHTVAFSCFLRNYISSATTYRTFSSLVQHTSGTSQARILTETSWGSTVLVTRLQGKEW